MSEFVLPEGLTTAFSPRVKAAERDDALRLLDGLKVRPDGQVPPVRYQRQLVVYMPKFAQVEDKKGYQIHINHIVAVSDAWDSGGYRWSPKGRTWQRLCNDPANLLAVSVRANTSKGDRDGGDARLRVLALRGRGLSGQVGVL